MPCKARQYSDQMQCSTCGLAWDMNDPEPPECPTETQETADKSAGNKFLNELRSLLGMAPRKHP